jgi:hypothetical protein
MADYTPVFTGGKVPFTSQTSAAVTGGQLVIPTGNSTCGPAGAAAVNVLGVAAHDAALGAKVTVWPLPGVTHEIVSTGTIAAGDRLVSGAAGVAAAGGATPAQDSVVGTAEVAATGGALVRFIGRA